MGNNKIFTNISNDIHEQFFVFIISGVMILIIGLVIFGPGKLPEIGSSVGRSMKEFRQAMAGQETKEAEKKG